MSINNITGSPVEGDNFFGREKELEFVWYKINKGNSIILSAPRRVGKSSFGKKLIQFAKKEKWNTLEINLEEIKSEESFIQLFIEKLQNENWWTKTKEKAIKTANQILESVKPTVKHDETEISLEWKAKKEDIYSKLKNLLDHKKDTLIMVDELTVLLNQFVVSDSRNGINNANFFLNWLRSFRQVSDTKIRWVFCSSIGIDNFTNMHNLSYTLNDIDPFPIGEFKKEQAIRFTEELSKSEKLNLMPDNIEYMIDKLGWNLPYFIQILFSRIHQLIEVYEKPASNNTIDEAYDAIIKEKHFNTWDERLKYYGEYEMSSRIVLKELSKIKTGLSRKNLFDFLYNKTNDTDKTESAISKVLTMLQNDGYIIDSSDSKYTFRSPLLRDFWFNRFVR